MKQKHNNVIKHWVIQSPASESLQLKFANLQQSIYFTVRRNSVRSLMAIKETSSHTTKERTELVGFYCRTEIHKWKIFYRNSVYKRKLREPNTITLLSGAFLISNAKMQCSVGGRQHTEGGCRQRFVLYLTKQARREGIFEKHSEENNIHHSFV